VAGELARWVLNSGLSEAFQPARPALHQIARGVPNGFESREDPGYAVFESIGGDKGRLLAAVAKLSIGDGYWAVTPPRLRREAGVSRRRFDALFADVAECYVEAATVLVVSAAERVKGRVARSAPWPERAEHLLLGFYAEVNASTLLARLGFADLLAPGRAGLLRRERLVTIAATWLRESAPAAERPGALAAEASILASWRVIQAELEAAPGPPR
jgi:hypothetical protein